MKNIFKFTVSLLVCEILLSGCGTPSTSLPGELVGKSKNYSQTLNIIDPSFFYSASDDNAENAKQQWLDEMSARYGVKINVTSGVYNNPTLGASIEKRWENILYGKESFPGLVNIDSIDILKTIVDDSRALPLDDYLADNPIWNALPEEIKSTFKIDGHIYAIPTSLSYSFNSRFISDDAIELTGITVNDLDTLKEFSNTYTQATGNYAMKSFGINQLRDIFSAFGLYYNTSTRPFGYDPTEDCMVDFLTKDAAIDALKYLRELYTAGALYSDFDTKTDDTTYDDISSGKIASIFDPLKKPDNCTELITLNQQYPQILENNVSGFFLTNDVPQPQEAVNLFIDMIFGSEQSYLDCWLGSSDRYIINSDGTITMNIVQNSDGSYAVPAMPNLTGGLTDVFPYSKTDILYNQNGVVTNDLKTEAGQKNKEYEMIKDALAKGMVVKVPTAYDFINTSSYNTTYDSNNSKIYLLYRQCITDAITNNQTTVEQAVKDYRKAIFNMGGNAMLDEMNAAIGKKTVYYYD
ncbi:MAG TPA: ABC transporter substrate-binding protein [Oscillospiraceae bacterium]|nr:ABC transporter substrate-binding protein [Oscillospiraceae bacterium]HPS35016.1 ABC transporter substrate-binding protein [Oscillospiraceae bacterium]